MLFGMALNLIRINLHLTIQLDNNVYVPLIDGRVHKR